MALEHALLVALLEKPGSGYALARRFDRSIGFFWHATHQQIYRVLARMEAEGLVRGKVVAQEGRLDKRDYSVTAAGRRELARWLRAPAEVGAVRSELMVKLRGAAFDEPRALLAEVARHRAAHAERLAQYRQIEARDFPDAAALARAQTLQHLVLRSGITYEEGWIAWCDEALATLEQLA